MKIKDIKKDRLGLSFAKLRASSTLDLMKSLFALIDLNGLDLTIQLKNWILVL